MSVRRERSADSRLRRCCADDLALVVHRDYVSEGLPIAGLPSSVVLAWLVEYLDRAAGYREVERFNDEYHAHHLFEKTL